MNPNKPDTEAEIADKRRKRQARRMARATTWVQRVLDRAEWLANAQVENEREVRAVLMKTLLKSGKASKSVLYPVVYKAFGNPGPGSLQRRALRGDIETVLGKLYLEGVIQCRLVFEGPMPDGPRVTSMIYLRPTNGQPVNIVAARVLDPVWGSSGLL